MVFTSAIVTTHDYTAALRGDILQRIEPYSVKKCMEVGVKIPLGRT
jgi:hypothetical protein